MILELIASVGLCWIIMHSELCDTIRFFLKKLTKCALCTGFWTGIFIFLIANGSLQIQWLIEHPNDMFTFAFASSAVCYLSEHVRILMDKGITTHVTLNR